MQDVDFGLVVVCVVVAPLDLSGCTPFATQHANEVSLFVCQTRYQRVHFCRKQLGHMLAVCP